MRHILFDLAIKTALKSRMPALIFLLVFLFTFWSNPSLAPKLSPDSLGYWSLAQNLGVQNEDASLRPWLFPLFIKSCMLISQDNWQTTLTFIQIIFHSLITTLLFSLFKNFKLNNIVCSIFALIIGFNPTLQIYTTYVLADLMLAVLTTLSWFYILRINREIGWNYNLIFFASLCCALCILTKPVGLLMIFPFLVSIYLVKDILQVF